MALTAAAFSIASPAQASVAQGYVMGSGAVNDDWGDEGTISSTTRNHNNVVYLWQTVLASDGYLSSSQVDCWFGANTKAATERWQRDHGVEVDGAVGPETFGRADDRLQWVLGSNSIQYNGSKTTMGGYARDANGYWYAIGYGVKISYTSASLCG
ncbi:hypothetical protein Kisp02_21660 [Kineosporia sp. NBRC 101731]|nr:hypothetical protein Kisp02_21660 [Kineosporia sp. NBRC 101731]